MRCFAEGGDHLKYPKGEACREYRVTLPPLSGGVNSRENEGDIADNQLTDCENLWWDSGQLCTRPGLKSTGWQYREEQDATYPQVFSRTDVRRGSRAFLMQRKGIGDFYPQQVDLSTGTVTSLGLAMAPLSMDGPGSSNMLLVLPPPTEENVELYAIGGGTSGAILKKKTVDSTEWSTAEPYVPTVMINGGARGEGTLYEDYNLLTGAFLSQFTTTGEYGVFYLPRQNLTSSYGQSAKVWYVDKNGGKSVFTIETTGGQEEDVSKGIQIGDTTVYARLQYQPGIVSFYKSNTDFTEGNRWIPPDVGFNNNLTILAYQTDAKVQRKIGKMQFSTWFGGNGGLQTGTRLFVSGNPLYPGLVCWSDVNRPLYFPENNYAYVGDAGEAVTAFGKQGNMLVIFKENSLYAMTYSAGSYTTSEVLSGAASAVTAAALFPVRQLHPAIGCDLPDTVVLCQNRLIWATSDGRVHLLLSETAYSETNVRELGRQIEPRLKAALAAGPSCVCACDWQGRYVLLVGSKAFVLDYTDTAYRRYDSYENDVRAQQRLSWYPWSLALDGVSFETILSDGTSLFLHGWQDGDTSRYTVCYRLDQTEDEPLTEVIIDEALDDRELKLLERRPVKAFLLTRLFDFDRPDRRKWVREVSAVFGPQTAGTVTVGYETEKGRQTQGETVFEAGGEAPRTGWVYRFSPQTGRTRRFGLRMDSVGTLYLGTVSLRYTLLEGRV